MNHSHQDTIRIICMAQDDPDLPGCRSILDIVEFDVSTYCDADCSPGSYDRFNRRTVMRDCRKWLDILKQKHSHLNGFEVIVEMTLSDGSYDVISRTWDPKSFPAIDSRNLDALRNVRGGKDLWFDYLRGAKPPITRESILNG